MSVGDDMDATLSNTAKQYLAELRAQLTAYGVDEETSAALLADTREGLAGLDDDSAAAQIDVLGWPAIVASNAAQEQGMAPTAPVATGKLTAQEWICIGLAVLSVVLIWVPFVGIGLALAALIWAVVSRRQQPGRFRSAFGVSLAALIANVVVTLLLLPAMLAWFAITPEYGEGAGVIVEEVEPAPTDG